MPTHNAAGIAPDARISEAHAEENLRHPEDRYKSRISPRLRSCAGVHDKVWFVRVLEEGAYALS